MDLQLRGKTAIVTGGSSNIGRAITLTLGREGANVVIAVRNRVRGDKVARAVEELGSKAICIPTDITNIESVEAMFGQALEQFGQVHILVNDAGGVQLRDFIENDQPYWNGLIDLNFRGHLNVMKSVLPHMVEESYGRVVTIGSDAGRDGGYREAVYAGCKGGMIAVTKAIAREVGRHNITLNVVCPGMTLPQPNEDLSEEQRRGLVRFTPEVMQKVVQKYPLRRVGTSQDVANAVVFLASDAANFITGQTLSVSGGYTMT